ncbi:H-NS histone family protein [Burkholderia gladioli]|nr:H-NS histone family protein [Burkholderia gladioli]
MAQVRELVTEYGITEDQIYGRKRAPRAAKVAAVAVEAKYQNPKSDETWSDCERAPLWIRDAKNPTVSSSRSNSPARIPKGRVSSSRGSSLVPGVQASPTA